MNGPPPERAGDEHDAQEHEADLRRTLGDAVELLVAQPQVEDAGERGERAGEVESRHGGGHVQVENLLRGALPRLDRREQHGTRHGADECEHRGDEQPVDGRAALRARSTLMLPFARHRLGHAKKSNA